MGSSFLSARISSITAVSAGAFSHKLFVRANSICLAFSHAYHVAALALAEAADAAAVVAAIIAAV